MRLQIKNDSFMAFCSVVGGTDHEKICTCAHCCFALQACGETASELGNVVPENTTPVTEQADTPADEGTSEQNLLVTTQTVAKDRHRHPRRQMTRIL